MNRIKQYKLDEQRYVSKQATSKRILFASAHEALIDFARDTPVFITLNSPFEEVKVN